MAYGGLVGQSSAEAENVSYNNNNTSTIITSDNVQGAIDQLFTSVSEGKSLVAKAVTDKGVQTALDATFETIAQNVGKIDVVTEATIRFPVEIVTIISRDDRALSTLPSNATHVLVISDYGNHSDYFGYKFYKIIGQTVQELSNEGSSRWKNDYTFEKYKNYWSIWDKSHGDTLRHLEFYYKQ